MTDPVAPEPATFTWPVNQAHRAITSPWGKIRKGKKHWGLDLGTRLPASSPTPILAVAPGTVVYRGVSGSLGRNVSSGAAGGGSGYGNCIVIYHGVDTGAQHIYSVYGHMNSFNVGMGAAVTQGAQIGVMGNSGGSYGTHLHFTIYRTRDGRKLPLPASGSGAFGFYEKSVSINPMAPTVAEGANSNEPFLR